MFPSPTSSNAKPALFSSYAALNAAGTAMTIMVLNKDPQNAAKVTFTLDGFTPSTVRVLHAGLFSPHQDHGLQFRRLERHPDLRALQRDPARTITGSEIAKPVSEWYANPDDLNGSRLRHQLPFPHPTISSGSGYRHPPLGGLRRLRGRPGLQRLAHPHQLHRHRHQARHHHRGRRQHRRASAITPSPAATAPPPRPRAAGSS